MISGVRVVPLKQIPDERGKISHMLRCDTPGFEKFGEIYFSSIWPGVIKGWHIHKEMTLNYAVPVGHIKLVYCLVTVPAMVWNGFKGIGDRMALVANCATIPHHPDEIMRCDPIDNHIPYDWALKHR
jgi:dTDP-4-dehydrorhamnose 3,5-epimerase